MSVVRYRVEVMHGVNLDQLGRRDPLLYGSLTLPQLERQIERDARELSLETRFFQTNHEGAFVEHLHGLDGHADAILLNPGSVDALRLGDPRRARDRRAAGARDPPLRRRGPRALAAVVGHPRPLLCSPSPGAVPTVIERRWRDCARSSIGAARDARRHGVRRRRARRAPRPRAARSRASTCCSSERPSTSAT